MKNNLPFPLFLALALLISLATTPALRAQHNDFTLQEDGDMYIVAKRPGPNVPTVVPNPVKVAPAEPESVLPPEEFRMEFEDGHWKPGARLHLAKLADLGEDFVGGEEQAQSVEEAAVKAVIERETKAWHNADVAAMVDCWANVPENRHLGSINDGNCTVIDNRNADTKWPENIKKSMAGAKPSGITFQNSDYKIRINGNAAFAQYEQVETAPDGTKTYAHQTRYLEKIGEAWKIIYVGFVYYKP